MKRGVGPFVGNGVGEDVARTLTSPSDLNKKTKKLKAFKPLGWSWCLLSRLFSGRMVLGTISDDLKFWLLTSLHHH